MRIAEPSLSQGPAGVEAVSKPSTTRIDTPFSYLTLSGKVVDVRSCVQANTYIFNPASFVNVEYPSTWPIGREWPPSTVKDLCCAPGLGAGDCVGDSCYTDNTCTDSDCDHTWAAWKQATQDWQQYFELRETSDRGIGVFTKRTFKRNEVLGWYAGELKPDGRGSYALEMTIGSMDRLQHTRTKRSDAKPFTTTTKLILSKYNSRVGEEVMIDAHAFGNWTRFINHSCDAYTCFYARRVGSTRISVIQANRDVPANVELTVNYGNGYFKHKACLCGSANCLKKKKKKKKGKEKARDSAGKDVDSTGHAEGVVSLENGMTNVQI